MRKETGAAVGKPGAPLQEVAVQNRSRSQGTLYLVTSSTSTSADPVFLVNDPQHGDLMFDLPVDIKPSRLEYVCSH